MIRINLLGQIRPKSARRPVDTGAALPAVFIGAGIAVGVAALFLLFLSWQKQLNEENKTITRLQGQKTELESIKAQVEAFDKQKQVLQQRVQTIEQLQRDRTGAQELLDEVAATVSRTENLWLTSMVRKGNSLNIEGASASINSVANFITALKRSGYFQKVEIKESKQDQKSSSVQTFLFQISADIAPPQAGQPAGTTPAKAKSASAPAQPATSAATPAKKG
jgi:type IV pilus assembly protein PilN